MQHMKVSELARIQSLSHAYAVTGNAGVAASEVLAMLETKGVKTVGNQDIIVLSFTEFSVENAREVSSYSFLKAIGEKKYIILTWSRATTQAQNALLKVVEEAPGGSIFFLCIDLIGFLIPTLRSRVIEVSVHAPAEVSEQSAEAVEFLKSSFEERLKMVEKMVAYISKTQDRARLRLFVKELLVQIHEQRPSPQTLRDLLDAEKYVRQQGVSAKVVLGHLAVSLPRNRR